MHYHVSEPYLTELELKELAACFQSGRITQGERVALFEERFASFLNVPYAVACNSGTSALHLALLALGVEPGDEILVPDLTFIATSNAVRYCGATPVFVDVDESSWCMSVRDAEAKINNRTVGLLPVHLYGVPCEMDGLRQLAEKHNLFVVEDAAEALGGSYGGKALGTLGTAGTFSFYGNKVLTTAEGGAVVCHSHAVYELLKMFRGQGMTSRRYEHAVVGYNYRMTDLHASIGLAQLSKLPEMLKKRAELVQFYRSRLGGMLSFPKVEGTAPWLFTGALPPGIDRNVVMERLEEYGIETRPGFIPLHLQPCNRDVRTRAPFRTGKISAAQISLPTHPWLTKSDIASICNTFEDVARTVQHEQ